MFVVLLMILCRETLADVQQPESVRQQVIGERSPASVSASGQKRHQRKMQSYQLQQERKRFLWACLNFENKPVKAWKKVARKLPELKATEGLLLEKQWDKLSVIVEEAVSNRGIASKGEETESEKSLVKMRQLREKFLLNSKGL